jgi:hypothetical protein
MVSVYRVPIECRDVVGDERPEEVDVSILSGDNLPAVDNPKPYEPPPEPRKAKAIKMTLGKKLL